MEAHELPPGRKAGAVGVYGFEQAGLRLMPYRPLRIVLLQQRLQMRQCRVGVGVWLPMHTAGTLQEQGYRLRASPH